MNKEKTVILMITSVAVMFTVGSCNMEKRDDAHVHAAMETSDANSDHDITSTKQEKVTFKDEGIHEVFQHYIHVRTALTNTDANEANSGAGMLMNSLNKIESSKRANEAASTIANSTDIETQRVAFSDLSEAMLALVKKNIASGELYLAHCPMAKNNTGANWISSTNEIKNPYFGDKMMKCGSVKETLN